MPLVIVGEEVRLYTGWRLPRVLGWLCFGFAGLLVTLPLWGPALFRLHVQPGVPIWLMAYALPFWLTGFAVRRLSTSPVLTINRATGWIEQRRWYRGFRIERTPLKRFGSVIVVDESGGDGTEPQFGIALEAHHPAGEPAKQWPPEHYPLETHTSRPAAELAAMEISAALGLPLTSPR